MSTNNVLKRALASRMVVKVLLKFDQTMAVVVGVCWGVALILMIGASLSVHSVLEAKKEAAEAIAATPVLPTTTSAPLDPLEFKRLIARLKRDYPELEYDLNAAGYLNISSRNVKYFQEWIGAVSYLDAMIPSYRWQLMDACVGKCEGNNLMQASVTAKKISFVLPPPATK